MFRTWSDVLVLLIVCVLVSYCYHIAAEDDYYNTWYDDHRQKCTSIGLGRKATADGSTITTHNNDCQECDLRITHVPAKDWPVGSKRPLYPIRDAYPRYVETVDNNIHGPDYLDYDRSIYNWTVSVPMAYIDQAEHTYAYTLGTYAIQNEKQVSIGESTCSSLFVAKPTTAGGKAMMHMETLTELALERCESARCAIELMGDLSMNYGFYGDGFDGSLEDAQDEAGEALTVADAEETWMFHIMADDTGAACVWVAQRVPDDHITVVANQFVIGEINLDDKDNFMASSNIYAVAERNNLWSSKSGVKFNFSYVYGTNRHKNAYACTRRVWRILTMAAPSLLPFFSPYTDGFASFGYGPDGLSPYPFSVKVDKLQTLQDIMRMNRDQYEGTVFDMTSGIDAGPFGDPMRYLPARITTDPVNGVPSPDLAAGLGFQRQISLWRTAYSTITQSRRNLPNVIGALTWVAPYAPHHSTFVPIYAAVGKTPASMRVGTEYKLHKGSNWWIHCITSNYLSKWYKDTIADIVSFQKDIESKLFKLQAVAENAAVLAYESTIAGDKAATLSAVFILEEYQATASLNVLDKWWDFFFDMVGKYRDVYKVINPHAENFNKAFSYLNIPKWYLEQVGYWGKPGTPGPSALHSQEIRPINVPSEDSVADYRAKYPNGFFTPYTPTAATSTTGTGKITFTPPTGAASGTNALSVIYAISVGVAIGSIVTYYITCRIKSRAYLPLN